MADIEGLIRAMMQEGKSAAPKTSREARIMHLQEVLKRFHDNKWEVGDIVTPAKDSGINGEWIGEPFIVLKIVTPEQADSKLTYEDSLYLIATIDNAGDIVAVASSGWKLDRYKGHKS